jgi:hypothetical protein
LEFEETLQVIDKSVTSDPRDLANIVSLVGRPFLCLNRPDFHMPPPDFLHKNAETKLCSHYIAAGAVCNLSTNSIRVLEAASSTLQSTECPPGAIDFWLRFWIDDRDPSRPPWPRPYVRGLNSLVFASFDEGSSMLADLRTRSVIGRFSAGMAADLEYWQTVIFPMLLSIVSASVGVAELHCACVARDRQGILLAGPSGAGKSTLALALSQQGFGFLSDDRIFCFVEKSEVRVWGLPTLFKLRPEAILWFDELREKQLTDARNGGPAFWLEPKDLRGVERVRECRPASLIFLERRDSPEFRLIPMSPAEAQYRLNTELMTELPEASAKRSEIIKKVTDLPCWLLHYGGQPHRIARQLSHHFVNV